MSNPYFFNSTLDQNSKEHEIYNSASNEIVQIFGIDFFYLPKTLIEPDYIFGESPLSQYNSAKRITMLIEDFQEYGGQGDLYEKFGLSIDDTLKLIVQQDNFNELVETTPQIGDLVYYPISDQLFSVNYVQLDDSFNQFTGANMTYRLNCILHKYSHNEMTTGINNVDNIENETDSNNTNTIDQLNSKASEIIDFTDDYFGSQ